METTIDRLLQIIGDKEVQLVLMKEELRNTHHLVETLENQIRILQEEKNGQIQ